MIEDYVKEPFVWRNSYTYATIYIFFFLIMMLFPSLFYICALLCIATIIVQHINFTPEEVLKDD